MFLLSFIFRYSLIFSLISSVIHWLFSSHVFVFSAVLTVDFLSHSIVVGKDAWYFNFLKFIEAHSVAQHVISPRECFLCTWEECVVFFLWLIHWSLCSILCLLTVFCFKLYFVLYEYWYAGFPLISTCMEYLFMSPHFQSVCVTISEVGLL